MTAMGKPRVVVERFHRNQHHLHLSVRDLRHARIRKTEGKDSRS
jgi:hypothetical protein